ncbi:MAG TPA: PilZ domain-containing protein [Candidatus Methylomirabilis sp.]|nr:PilZ domain-containing protein [Candidatus Methylomirabilis sp.]
MTDLKDRRGAPRVVIPGRIGSRVRATIEARILDLSTSGARIEHQNLLRPGFACTLELPPALGAHSLAVRVVRSTVVGTEQSGTGERLLRYESGLAFVGITEEQQIGLKQILERLTPGGGLGEGKLVL